MTRRRRAWTCVHSQPRDARGGGIRDQIRFLLRWRGRRGNLGVRYSCRPTCGSCRGQGQRFPKWERCGVRNIKRGKQQQQTNESPHLSNSVMPTSIVVGSILLSTNNLLRVVQLTVRSAPYFVAHGGLQIHVHGTGDVLSGTRL